MTEPADDLHPYVLQRAEQDGVKLEVLESMLRKARTTGKPSMTEAERDAYYWLGRAGRDYESTDAGKAELRGGFLAKAPSWKFVDDDTFQEQVAQSESAVLFFCGSRAKVMGSAEYVEQLVHEYRDVLECRVMDLYAQDNRDAKKVTGDSGARSGARRFLLDHGRGVPADDDSRAQRTVQSRNEWHDARKIVEDSRAPTVFEKKLLVEVDGSEMPAELIPQLLLRQIVRVVLEVVLIPLRALPRRLATLGRYPHS
jgi:hypothetical protein